MEIFWLMNFIKAMISHRLVQFPLIRLKSSPNYRWCYASQFANAGFSASAEYK